MKQSAGSEHARAFVDAVEAALAEAGVVAERGLLAAVSGGPDSMALLDALQEAHGRGGPAITVCHFNHRLRRDESDADEAYVREEAERRGLPVIADGADVRDHAAANGLSLEDAARRLRYAFLARTAAEIGAQAAATGHTLDDQAETVLLHIIRGSGLSGVRGMRLVSNAPLRWGGVPLTIVRPLLRQRRDDTERYCRERGISPRQDASNLSTTFSRNRLRMNVMPELSAINPRVVESISRLSDTAAEEQAALREVVDGLWSEAHDDSGDDGGKTVTLRRSPLLATAPALRRSLLRRAFALVTEVAGSTGNARGAQGTGAGGSPVDLTRSHLMEMARLIEAGAGRSLDLPGGIRFETRVESVLLSTDEAACPFPPVFGMAAMSVPGEVEVAPGWLVRAIAVDTPEDLDAGSSHAGFADADAIGGRVTARGRRDGDRFQPLGMAEPARLQDVFVNAGVPRAWRDRAPVLEAGRGIAWVAGLRVAEWARVTPETRQVVRLELCQKDGG